MIHFQTLKTNKNLRQFCLLLISSFFLLLPALNNGFPLTTPDTGAYISSGWIMHVPIDRPITYGIFIRITSLFGLSLWGAAWAQTFILAYFLKRVTEKLLSRFFTWKIFLVIVLLLTCFTTLPWFASQLTPDIFTAILALSIADFYLSPKGTVKKRILSFFLIWLFIQMHNSHLLIALVFCVVARLYSLVARNKWFIKKTTFLFGVTIFSFISISFFNLWEGNKFRPSAGTHVFLMARMTENGILDRYLKEYCPTEHYSICDYQGKTGDKHWEFMWSDKGHLHDAGSWGNAEKEYNTIILKTLTKPRYLVLHLYESLEGTFKQLSQFTIEFTPQGVETSPYDAVQQFYPREIKEYRTSLQQLDQLRPMMSTFDVIFLIFGIGSMVATLLLYKSDQKTPDRQNWNFVLMLFIGFIVVNAFITSTFSAVYCRLESRVAWLLPFICCIYLLQYYFITRDPDVKTADS